MKEFLQTIKDIGSGAMNGNGINSDEGVIVVDSIEEFMSRNNTTHLRDLDTVLGIPYIKQA